MNISVKFHFSNPYSNVPGYTTDWLNGKVGFEISVQYFGDHDLSLHCLSENDNIKDQRYSEIEK